MVELFYSATLLLGVGAWFVIVSFILLFLFSLVCITLDRVEAKKEKKRRENTAKNLKEMADLYGKDDTCK